MFCVECGIRLADDSAYCHSCGFRLVTSEGTGQPVSGGRHVERSKAPTVVARSVFAMIALAVAASAVVAVLALSGVIGGGDSGSAESQIRSMLHREAELLNKRALEPYYELFDPQSRSNCSLEEFKREAGFAFLIIGDNELEVRDISVNVEGDVAYASYDLYLDGELFNHDESDRFVKIDGRWFDDDDERELC